MEHIARDIGTTLKNIRKEMHINLDTAAKLTGVSKAMLGQIERGESAPTVLTLWKISTGLKVSFSHLISNTETESTVVNVHGLSRYRKQRTACYYIISFRLIRYPVLIITRL